ncbi:MAG: 4-hydroxy-tetrahydrodipicolinate synthase [Clostridia bacterium]
MFKGVCTALVSPYDQNGLLTDQLASLIEYQINGNVDCLLVNGSTGEPTILSQAERTRQLEVVTEVVNTRCKIMASCGGTETQEVIKDCLLAQSYKVDYLLVVTPYYNKTNSKGILKHYFSIADKVDTPIILYNVPSRTGYDLDIDTVIELSKHPNIVGLKQANGNIASTSRLIPYLDNFALYCGDDALLLPFYSIGSQGIISVVSNAYVRLLKQLCYRPNLNDFHNLVELASLLFSSPNPTAIKYVLYKLGLLDTYFLRSPLVEIDDNLKIAIDLILPKYDKYL